MQAGALDRIVTIKEEQRVKDANSGQTKLSFVTLYTRRAHVKPRRGGEEFREEQLRKVAKEVYIFTFRYFSELTAKHLLSYDSKDFNITRISEIGRKRWLEVEAEHTI